MTTIAYRDGKMVSDMRISLGDVPIGSTRKLHVINGYAIGCSGERSEIELFVEWLKKGGDKPKWADDGKCGFSAMLVDRKTPTVVQYYWTTEKGNLIRDDITCKFLAIGSGKFFAMGAMQHGASALEAVKAASALDPWTGHGCEVLHLEHGTIDTVQ